MPRNVNVSSQTLEPTVDIEIYSDVVCPWCYLGKRRLEAALAASPFAGEAILRWRPSSSTRRPARGSAAAGLAGPAVRRRGPGPRRLMAQVTAIAEAEGLTFDFDRAAHREHLRRAPPAVVRRPAGGRLLRRHRRHPAASSPRHCTGRTSPTVSTSGSHDVLVDARRRGAVLTSTGYGGCSSSTEAHRRRPRADARASTHLGITSVPTFIFAGTYAAHRRTATVRTVPSTRWPAGSGSRRPCPRSSRSSAPHRWPTTTRSVALTRFDAVPERVRLN